MLEREEYVEQAHFFRTLGERLGENSVIQDLFRSLREEVLATTKLPLAIDYMLAELKHAGMFAPAMKRMSHYFTAFQTYIVSEAENERGRFDMLMALEVLRREAEYRAEGATPAGMFLYQFETLCRNRLKYDPGLDAMAEDPLYDENWREWIRSVRRRIGMAELADLIYVRSEHYGAVQARRGEEPEELSAPLFGEREGRIALANRHKEPLFLFSALHRQLGYPAVPRPRPPKQSEDLLPGLARRVERMEKQIKILEEEARGGLDLTRFYKPPAEEEKEGSN
jgi:hypothetical protein